MNKPSKSITYILLMFLVTFGLKLNAQESKSPCGSGITAVLKGEILTVTALYKNADKDPVYYYHELTIKKSGGTNVSSNTQTGRISVQPGIEKSLAESSLNIAAGDIVDIELKILDNDKVICSTKHQFVAPRTADEKP